MFGLFIDIILTLTSKISVTWNGWAIGCKQFCSTGTNSQRENQMNLEVHLRKERYTEIITDTNKQVKNPTNFL